MKKILFITALFGLMVSTSANAQGLATYKVSNPAIVTSGSFTQPASYVPANPGKQSQIFPWYTKLDTVTNTGVDTFKQNLKGVPNAVYTWVNVSGISGTNTSCVVKLWGSADSSNGVMFVPIYTATVTATNPVAYYAFNNGTNWYYTNFWWTFTGSGTQVSSWYAGLMVR